MQSYQKKKKNQKVKILNQAQKYHCHYKCTDAEPQDSMYTLV